MNFPIVHEYRNDILNQNPENRVLGEPFKVIKGPGSRIVIPVHAPFFVKSLRLYNANMEPLTKADDEGVGDWRMYKIMGGLTELTAKPVGCMIEILNPDVTDGFFDYDIVGHFSLFDNTLLRLILETAEDNRPVYWENLRDKPVVFPPELHGMSLIYDMIAFGDMVELITLLLDYLNANSRTPTQIKIEHYLDLLNNYITVYRTELLKSLARHEGSYDAHGLTKGQIGLPLVDNFATARGDDLLKPNNDMHLTPGGLKTIINTLSFNAPELLASNKVPLSSFGNTNFIPANIDGSFEGFGGVTEAGGMCLESDGTITFLWNRMDGRTAGLYYSVMQDTEDYAKTKLVYSGFKYEHPKFDADNASVDRIAQGSGDEVILVGDSRKNLFYVGVTNGSLDPAKHVYSKVNLQPIVDATFGGGTNIMPSSLFPMLSVALMGEWIYLIQSSSKGSGLAPGVGYPLVGKQFFRVKLADVQATINVTPTLQLVSFVDADGVQWNNSTYFRWYSFVNANGLTSKALFTYSPTPANGVIGNYRSLPVMVAEDPSRKGIYAMKFLSAYYGSHSTPTGQGQFNFVPEINYDFDPVTGVMTLTSKTAIPPTLNILGSPILPSEYVQNNVFYSLVFSYAGQGINVLPDGRIASSAAMGFSGFPRVGTLFEIVNAKTKYATISKFWGRGWDEMSNFGSWQETIASPLMSSINVRGLLYRPGGEHYIAADRTDLGKLELFWKDINGKFAARPEVTNLFLNNVVSRPLTTSIRKVNALPGIGGATVSVPSSQLDTYGIDVGESMFCTNSQKKYNQLDKVGTGWGAPVGDNDILLISDYNRRIEPDGTITIVPTAEILYPSAIVEQLKNQVEFLDIKNRSRDCIVTVTDPTFSSLERFGWLPIIAAVTYVDAENSAIRARMHATYMVIQPTYITNAQGRKEVTGFTVTDKFNWWADSAAIDQIRVFGGYANGPESPQSTLGPMRAFYYLNGNSLSCHLNSGVMGNTTGDAYTSNFNFAYNNRNTRRWTSASQQGNSSAGGGVFITPDNGIATMYDWANTTGGAATIVNGVVNRPVVGSVYPEVGWVIFFKTDIKVVFNGKPFVLPSGTIDLRDISPSPQNKTFYVYAALRNGVPIYEVVEEKRLETPFQLWASKVVTGDSQILTIERFNVFAMNGNRVSETKRGNCIPASSGLANEEGQLPWLRNDELLT